MCQKPSSSVELSHFSPTIGFGESGESDTPVVRHTGPWSVKLEVVKGFLLFIYFFSIAVG